MNEAREQAVVRALWEMLGGDPSLTQQVAFSGPQAGLPSRFEVGALASGAVAVASLAAAELWAKRRGEPVRRVLVDRRHAAAAFRCEALLKPLGWSLTLWDPIAGDYRAKDGWIRLHTNYAHHRRAALSVLGAPAEKAAVAEAVKRWSACDLETAVVEAGGCAAALRTSRAWSEHPQGLALAGEPLVAWGGGAAHFSERGAPSTPLRGVRVLDLTRVIAGPIGTRLLAAFGAEVLRVDPPGFEEVPLLTAETTRGKRCATLDLKESRGRAAWEKLVAGADVLVHGYRPGAMEALGYGADALRALNPALAVVRYDAYGWSGPWAGRRGFDSLVQMSSGIACPEGGADTDARPTPLPAQALDHGTGHLVAAAACRSLAGHRASSRLSLARTAKFLADLGTSGNPDAAGIGDPGDLLERSETAFGPALQLRPAVAIEGYSVAWTERAGPLGRHEARWAL